MRTAYKMLVTKSKGKRPLITMLKRTNYQNKLPDSILSQMNPVYIITPYFSKIHLLQIFFYSPPIIMQTIKYIFRHAFV